MNKILITIFVVSLNEEFDLLLPIGLKTSDAIEVIQDSLGELSNGNYQKKEEVDLYTADGLIINKNNIVKFSGIKNGSKLLLF